MKKKLAHLVDMIVQEVADKMIKEPSKSRILVCGTQAAATHRLYPDKLAQQGIQSDLPNKEVLQFLIDLIKSGESDSMLVDKIKNIHHTEKDLYAKLKNPLHKTIKLRRGGTVGEGLVHFMVNALLSKKNHPYTHVMLSCTELPLCLHATLPQSLQKHYFGNDSGKSKTYQDLFNHLYTIKVTQKRLPNKSPPQIIDTEHLMAHFISKQQIINNQRVAKKQRPQSIHYHHNRNKPSPSEGHIVPLHRKPERPKV